MSDAHTFGPVAVIDVGSNSIKLLVAMRGEEDRPVHVLCHQSEETRISAGISQKPLILDSGLMDAGILSVEKLLTIAKQYEPVGVQIVATSAVREADNKDEFCQKIQDAFGYPLHVLSGDEEAQSIALGIATDPALKHFDNYCLFDLGGGSLELIRYEGSKLSQAISVPLGAVRLTERFFPKSGEAMTGKIADEISYHVRQVITKSGFHFPQEGKWILIGTGGAVTVTRAMLGFINHKLLNLTPSRCSQRVLEKLFAKVATKPLSKRLNIKGLPPKRADIYPAALAAILTIMRMTHKTVLYHSYHNLRFGLAYKMLSELT